MYSTDEREREREREKSHLCVYVSTSFLPSGRSREGGIVFFICVDTLLYTMTFLDGKYDESCRFPFFTTKNHHKNFVEIDHRRPKMESKCLFSSGNSVIFGFQEGVFETGFLGGSPCPLSAEKILFAANSTFRGGGREGRRTGKPLLIKWHSLPCLPTCLFPPIIFAMNRSD